MHIDANADDCITKTRIVSGFYRCFNKDSTEFLIAEEQIVRPANVDADAGSFVDGLPRCETGSEGEQKGIAQMQRGFHQGAEVEAVARSRVPGMAATSASGSLFVGDINRAFAR